MFTLNKVTKYLYFNRWYYVQKRYDNELVTIKLGATSEWKVDDYVFLVDIDNTTLGKIISKDYIKVFTKILDNDILVDVC